MQEYWSGLPFPSPMHACMLSCFSPVRLCAILWTAAHQAPPSTGFSRQEYWSGLPFPSPIFTLLYIKQITNKNLPYSTGNLSQYSVIIYKEKQSEKKNMCFQKQSEKEYTHTHSLCYTPTHCAVYLKLTWYCKSTVLQSKKKYLENHKFKK